MTVVLSRPDLEALAANLDPVDRFLELLGRPAWHARAACAPVHVSRFFPERGESVEPAQAICRGCPVRAECLDFALEHDPRALSGIWAGTTWNARIKARGDRDRLVDPPPGATGRFSARDRTSDRCDDCGATAEDQRNFRLSLGRCRRCYYRYRTGQASTAGATVTDQPSETARPSTAPIDSVRTSTGPPPLTSTG